MYFNFILLKEWNEFGKIELLKLLLVADNNKSLPTNCPNVDNPWCCHTHVRLIVPWCPLPVILSITLWWPQSQALGGHGSPLWGHRRTSLRQLGKINRLYSPDSLLRLLSPAPSCCRGLYQHINICSRFIEGTHRTGDSVFIAVAAQSTSFIKEKLIRATRNKSFYYCCPLAVTACSCPLIHS